MQQVPKYIDIEDKVAGPLTWKHLQWIFGGGGILVIFWNTLDQSAFWTVAIPIGLITLAFAFYKPQGMPLITFVWFAITYFFKPKLYLWQRESHSNQKKNQKNNSQYREQKVISIEEIEIITETLDTHGKEKNERLDQLIRANFEKTLRKKEARKRNASRR